jgi:endonuclease YncB( thermonuclease family)
MDVALILPLLLAAAPLPAFQCTVTRVHDGDGPLWCSNGAKIRVAGIQAPDFEAAEPCRRRHRSYVCSDPQAKRSQQVVERLTLGKSMECQPVDRSYTRVVARCTLPDGRSLSCAIVAAGAATRWPTYWRRYQMSECR